MEEDKLKAEAYQKFQRAARFAKEFSEQEFERLRHQYVEYYLHKKHYSKEIINEYLFLAAWYKTLPEGVRKELE